MAKQSEVVKDLVSDKALKAQLEKLIDRVSNEEMAMPMPTERVVEAVEAAQALINLLDANIEMLRNHLED